MIYIYILELKENKYYIGKTYNPNFRIEQHFDNNGSKWTIKYKPIKCIKIIPNCDNYDEDKYTIKYMEQYGINNVRGGTFCDIKLKNETILLIEKMINSSNNKCFKCGRKGHYANECYSNTSIDNADERCFKCGRKGHYANECYSNTSIDNTERCFKCGRKGHYANECYSNTSIDNTDERCFKCGRKGHYANECYSKYYN